MTTPTTYIEVGEYEKLEEEGITYYSIEFKTDSIMEPAVTSSNPDRCSIKMMEYKEGVVLCLAVPGNNKRGAVTFTVKATDGTGKTKKFTMRI